MGLFSRVAHNFMEGQRVQDEALSFIEHKVYERYGIRIDKNNSDPEARCTYLYDAVGFTPKTLNSIGSWGNAFFVRHNYPVMCLYDGTEDYKLDPDDHSKKLDGTASDISDSSYGGNAMAAFDCPIWMKFYEDENYTYFEVASEKLDDDFVDWPYIRANGTHASKIYYPMFEGTIIDSKLRSIAGVKASSNTTASEEQTAALANGTNWSIGDWSHHLWLTVLMTLMGKSTNVQATFGNGNMSGGYSAALFKTNGACMTEGQFYGTTGSSDPMKAFFIENVYANRWKRTLGFYNINGTYYIKNTPPYTVDETYDGYTSCGSVPSSNNYLKNLRIANGNPVPNVTSGDSASTYYSDYFYTDNNQKNMLLLGGDCHFGAICGPWCVYVYYGASIRYWGIGASPYLACPEIDGNVLVDANDNTIVDSNNNAILV